MGKTYAAAQLTLIAAAGKDAEHGLPGIDPSSRRLDREDLGSLQLTILPRIVGLEAVYKSVCAARAWTFQKGFFSRRRLIFTDQQAFFVCNSMCGAEIRHSPRIGLAIHTVPYTHVPPWLCQTGSRFHHPMVRAMSYLEQYSTRDLSYETGAFDAIVGALNVLNGESVYHIWGCPLWRPGRALQQTPLQTRQGTISERRQLARQEGSFALLWRHEAPAVRGQGFLSWSPIG